MQSTVIKNFEGIREYVERFGLTGPIQEDFFVYRYDEVKTFQGFYDRTFRNHFFEISLDLSDGCSYFVDHFQCASVKHRISLISPYRVQSMTPSEILPSEMKGYSLFFRPSFLHLNVENTTLTQWLPMVGHRCFPQVQLDDHAIPAFVDIFEKIILYHQRGSTIHGDIIRHYIHILLLLLREHYQIRQVSNKGRNGEIYDAFIQLLENTSPVHHSVQQFAEKLNISAKHFSETIKAVSGKSAVQLINERRTDFAKSLLLQTNMSTKEVAAALQFENETYFYTFFKRMTRCTPSEFRKK